MYSTRVIKEENPIVHQQAFFQNIYAQNYQMSHI